MTSMISTGSRDGSARLGRGMCDQVIMPGAVISVPMVVSRAVIDVRVIIPRAVIDVRVIMPRAVIDLRVVSGLGMIMLVCGRCWFGEWIADVVGN
jgi:hypothetical protein